MTTSHSGLLAFDDGRVDAAMVMFSPVLGLRPLRAVRDLVEKVPKREF